MWLCYIGQIVDRDNQMVLRWKKKKVYYKYNLLSRLQVLFSSILRQEQGN